MDAYIITTERETHGEPTMSDEPRVEGPAESLNDDHGSTDHRNTGDGGDDGATNGRS